MKIKYNIGLIICSMFLLFANTACEDFLEVNPKDGLSEEDAYKDFDSMRGVLDRAYTFLPNYILYNGVGATRTHIGTISDELASITNGTASNKINSGNWLDKNITAYELGVNSKNGGTVIYRSYMAIRIVNRVINDIDRVPGLSEDQEKQLLGQAYFLRAFFYFQLIQRYGGMPILDKVLKGDGDDDLPRKTYHESHDWMMTDIENAIAMLPDVWDEDNTGRPNKVAAMALKSMSQLYDASPLMQNGLESIEVKPYDKERAALAAKSAQEVLDYVESHPETGNHLMATGEYENENYTNIFYWVPPAYTQPEFLWYNRANNGNQGSSIRVMWLPTEFCGGGAGIDIVSYNAPTQNMIDLYEKKGEDGNYYPITENKAGYDSQNPYADRDPRFYNNILYPGLPWGKDKSGKPLYVTSYIGGSIDNTVNKSNYTNQRKQTGYICRKFIWDTANGYQTDWFSKIFPTVYIRMAQIYLDLAEASFEATGSATDKVEGCKLSALDAINVIRKRAGITPVTEDIYSNPDKFREAVRRERAVELMFENHRWWDLRRWMIAHEVFADDYPIKGMAATPKDKNHASVEDKSTLEFNYEVVELTPEVRVFDMRNYWYPFSLDDVNGLDNLKQNPGW